LTVYKIKESDSPQGFWLRSISELAGSTDHRLLTCIVSLSLLSILLCCHTHLSGNLTLLAGFLSMQRL
jgi:hypothetical protein